MDSHAKSYKSPDPAVPLQSLYIFINRAVNTNCKLGLPVLSSVKIRACGYLKIVLTKAVLQAGFIPCKLGSSLQLFKYFGLCANGCNSVQLPKFDVLGYAVLNFFSFFFLPYRYFIWKTNCMYDIPKTRDLDPTLSGGVRKYRGVGHRAKSKPTMQCKEICLCCICTVTTPCHFVGDELTFALKLT